MVYSEEVSKGLFDHTLSYLEVKQVGHVLRVQMNRPHKKNAITQTTAKEMALAMSYAHYEPSVWAIVWGAHGNVWCAGMDLKALRGIEEENNSTVPEPEKPIVLGELFTKVHKPVIARVHAPVYAGGHLLVGGATHVFASPSVFFSLPEVERGLFPFQVMDLLLKTLPPRKVLDWCMRGGKMEASEAHSFGLVTHLVPEEDLDAKIQEFLDSLFVNSPSAIRLGLKAYDEMRSVADADKQAFLKRMFEEIVQTQDAQEGLKAFAEKRKPVWTGK